MTSKARTAAETGPPFLASDTGRSGLACCLSMVDYRGHGITDDRREQ